ncbi:MAG: [protein-PII] uridylyltransferase [Pseudomonadota bacterium]
MNHLPVLATLSDELNTAPVTIAFYKYTLETVTQTLAQQFTAGTEVRELLYTRACCIDMLLHRLWVQHMPPTATAALIAVGGYGRAELHPASDIDLLILTADNPESLSDPVTSLITFLWDIGLQVGHSVRNLTHCLQLATDDVSVMTNLLESRYLSGQEDLYTALQHELNQPDIWPSADFFVAKRAEQQQRHARLEDSACNLEPDIKQSPGGLRDIQTIGWIAKRYLGTTQRQELKKQGLLSGTEYRQLCAGEDFLWQVRYALHQLTGRQENRLLFEHQRALAQQFGYTDNNANLAVEQFMQRYYRTAIRLQRLNELFLQLFQELITPDQSAPEQINARFQVSNGYLEVVRPDIFRQQPLAMLELFLILQQRPELTGVRANTIRAIRTHRHRVDATLRADIQAHSLFMEILRQPAGITHALRRMHRYGILSRYIPAFHQVTGLMQFDLFHVYTVDEHTLMVLRHMRRFALPDRHPELADYHPVWLRIAKPELLYLAALFHDLGKGGSGNHSTTGAINAHTFCQQHHLSAQDCELVAWLVKKHLMMSHTAQHQDIDDDTVIQAFADEIVTPQHLHALYLLTVADMQGTNPSLWTSWKQALLARLYQRTHALLQHHNTPAAQQRIQTVQQAAQQQLSARTTLPADQIATYWSLCSNDYFLQTTPEAIAWHTATCLQHSGQQQTFRVLVRQEASLGCTEIFTFGPDRDGLFVQTAATLNYLGLNILSARIEARGPEQTTSSYFVLTKAGEPVPDHQCHQISQYLTEQLNQAVYAPHTSTLPPLPRRLQQFACETQVQLQPNVKHTATLLELITQDRPGLLAHIGVLLEAHQLRLHNARILTEGAIVHDRFRITDRNDRPVTDRKILKSLKKSLLYK